MNKKLKVLGVTIPVAALSVCSAVFSFSMHTSASYSVEITDLPSNIISGQIEYLDENWNNASTSAKVSVKSGKADVSGLANSGYYNITFYTDKKETGMATFFMGESGTFYTYDYEYKNGEYSPVYTAVDSVKYEDYGYAKLLDISGNNSVLIYNVPDETVTAEVYVSLSNGDYGDSSSKVTVKDETVTFNFGVSGNYFVTFFDKNYSALGTAEFMLKDNGDIFMSDYEYNSTTGEWEESLSKVDSVYCSYEAADDFGAASNEDSLALYSVSIKNIPSSVSKTEIIYMNEFMEQIDSYADVKISNGTSTINNISNGYYTLNFYNSSDTCVGCSMFYLDANGDIYTYDRKTKLNAPTYSSVEQSKSYTFGNISVSIYNVYEDVDSVEAFYYFGNESDEVILFEPDMSSVAIEPMIISNLGMAGKYKLNFYSDGVVIGNADFYLDETGKVYDYDYSYNSKTGQWEESLVETEEIYYYKNTDIEDSDNYGYGNIKFTITNVPSNIKYAEVTYFEEDNTFTAGRTIFPDIVINGKGTASINNFGQSGYYEVDLLLADGLTKAGYVFIYIDEKLNTYYLKQSINTDTFQVETAMTKTVQIPLEQYLSNTISYVSGNQKVTVNSVPTSINKMLVTCVTPNGEYATYEKDVTVNANGQTVIDKLGMEGDYTISFFTGKEYAGSASFYLGSDGKIYQATYSYDSSMEISIALTSLGKVIYQPNENAVSYSLGDIDFNGNINIADAVMLQKYLLNIQPFTASQFYNADMNNDGSVDVFDMVLMRKALIE